MLSIGESNWHHFIPAAIHREEDPRLDGGDRKLSKFAKTQLSYMTSPRSGTISCESLAGKHY